MADLFLWIDDLPVQREEVGPIAIFTIGEGRGGDGGVGVSDIAAVSVQWEEVYGMLLCQLKGTPSKGASRVLSVEMDFFNTTAAVF